MDPTKILSLLEQLDDDIDDIEDAVAPFLQKTIPEFATKLPLLDKAKLYTLVTYAIESILFSYLRLNGVNAREHSVFTELTRMKQYFEKIKLTENPPIAAERNLKLDKGAAGRFIKAGLSGNDKYDLLKAEQMAKERARSHIKFEELSKKRKMDEEAAESNKAKSKTSDVSDSSSSLSDSSDAPESEFAPVEHKSKKSKTLKVEAPVDIKEDSSTGSKSKSKKGKEKKTKSRSKKSKSKN
ncbi:hypothetical protein EYC80_010930 [Monilinia laxa]|uniref:Exosome complex protein n=1 Tax=Monilinia laxa TaxID=61186 RepID=A0A5N6JS83_MONLA|nr:hypothetical protein EYC80_010930 [Monilinia laxa]